jgi:tetratricopeptide (TPR) repeat protein
MRRTIREKQPLRPSNRISTLQGDDLNTAARQRHTDPPKLIHLVRGDLDWIVMKALEKDRARRYETANGLGMDILRHINCEPVVARPPSRLYEFQKTVRRHKFGFAAAAALIAVLAAGVIVSTWMFFKEQQARQQAEVEREAAKMEAAKATAISDFFQQSLRAANPDELKGSDYTVRNLLDDFSSGLGNQFKDQPEVEASVRETIGKAYYRLGVPDKAQEQLERALMLNRRLYGEHDQAAATLADCAWASFEQGQLTNAESQARAALDIYRKDGTVGQPVLFAFWALQETLNSEGRYADVETVTKQALDIARQTPGQEFPETASIIHGLAQAKISQSKYADAETLARQALEMHQRLQGSQHPETGWGLKLLGDALLGQKKLDEAGRAYREALSIFRKQYPIGHKSLDQAMGGLKNVLEAKGDLAGLVALDQTILADQRSGSSNDSSSVETTLFDLANFLASQNRPEAASQEYREALNSILKPFWDDPIQLPPIMQKMAQKLVATGQPQFAESLYADAIEIARQNLGKSHPVVAMLCYDFGNLLRNENKLAAAAEQCRNALQIQSATKDEALAATLRVMGWLQLYTGKPEEAEQSLREVLDIYRALPRQGDYQRTAYPDMNLGIALFDQHKLAEAEHFLREAVALISPYRATNEDNYIYSACCLAMVLKAENKLTESESLLHDASSKEGDAAVAAQLIENASFLPKGIWPDEAGKWLRYSSEILDKAPAEDVAKQSQVVSMLVEAGYEHQATNLCRRMLNSSSTNALWFNNASWCLATTENPTNRDPALAVELANRAVKINPNGDWNTVGVAYYRIGDFKQALPYLESGNGGNSWAFFFLAMANRQLGNADAARRYYDQAIQWMNDHDPQNPELLRFRAEAEQLFNLKVKTGAENQPPASPAAR